MERFGQHIQRYWKAGLVVAAGAGASAMLPTDAYKDVTQELIALLGLMIAAVLPAMVLTASALRAGNLSVKRLTAYRNALITQLKIWFGIFLISLGCALTLVFGKAVDWTISLSLPSSLPWLGGQSYEIAKLITGIVSAGLLLIVLRVPTIGRGMLALLKLSAEAALSDAAARDEGRFGRADEEIKTVKSQPNHGAYVDLPH